MWFWKQITTTVQFFSQVQVLFIRSKIQFFESKSQPILPVSTEVNSCLSDQRYNFLKANHNGDVIHLPTIQLFIRSKIQFFESKSQPIHLTPSTHRGCLSDQRYNFLKANHNLIINCPKKSKLFIRSKIQFFESKSQPFFLQ